MNLQLPQSNPEKNYIYTIDQVLDSVNMTKELIEGLDDHALNELFSGTESDVDLVIDTTISEFLNIVSLGQSSDLTYSPNVLQKFGECAQETFRKASFAYFLIDVLPGFTMSWHHLEWANIVQLYKWFSVIASRDHGKSYLYSFAYPLWKLYRYEKTTLLRKARKEYELSREGMIITNERSLSEHFLAQIKAEIEDNQTLNQALFPGRQDGWGGSTIRCKNGASLFVKSYGSKMRGRHPTWMMCDDFLNDQVLYSKSQRDKYIDFFNAVIMNMIVPGGSLGIVGTPYHSADLYGYLKKSGDGKARKGWRVFEYPAIFPDGSLLWEGRHNLEGLLEKRETQGSLIFSREILVKPVTSESSIFPMEILKRSLMGMEQYKLVENIQSFPINMSRVVEGCDFAISASASADYSVFITLGITRRDEVDHYWLLNVWHEKGQSYKTQRQKLKSKYINFKFDIAVLESVQMQQIFVEGAKEDNLPVEGHHTNQKSKYSLDEGLPSLAILFEQGRFHFPYGDEKSKAIVDMIFDQLAGMAWSDKGIESTTEHDDLVMGLLMAIIAARKGTGFSYGFI